MSETERRHRLDGLTPDNLLAFLALLGLLRSLEEAAPFWQPRVAWSVDAPPMRPVLSLAVGVERVIVVATAAAGLNRLAARHDFAPLKNLRFPQEAAAEKLRAAAAGDRYTADLWAALVSDAAVRERNKISGGGTDSLLPDVRPGSPALSGAVERRAAPADAWTADHAAAR